MMGEMRRDFSFAGLKLVLWFEVLAKIVLVPGCSSRLDIFPCQVMWLHIKTARFFYDAYQIAGIQLFQRIGSRCVISPLLNTH